MCNILSVLDDIDNQVYCLAESFENKYRPYMVIV